MKQFVLLILVLNLSACSLSDAKKDEVAVTNDDLEFAVDTIADQASGDEFKVEEETISQTVIPDEYLAPPVEETETAMIVPEEPKFEEFKRNESIVEAPAIIKVEETFEDSKVFTSGQMEKYRVQKGDTLMMISFKIYGDYRKWKDLKEWNPGIGRVREGMELKYSVPDQTFGWRPNGSPHLVKTGETLQVISMDKYGTTRKWKSIYENNRPLIRDPNLIFAGFTIYYQPARELASEKK